jgi:hypothetical protein
MHWNPGLMQHACPPEPHLLHVFGIANASANELAEGHVSPPQAHHV